MNRSWIWKSFRVAHSFSFHGAERKQRQKLARIENVFSSLVSQMLLVIFNTPQSSLARADHFTKSRSASENNWCGWASLCYVSWNTLEIRSSQQIPSQSCSQDFVFATNINNDRLIIQELFYFVFGCIELVDVAKNMLSQYERSVGVCI